VMVVKEWAKRRGINNASRSTFTSYSLVLMVIHYLQCGANPPVLPSLQLLYPTRFNSQTDVSLLNVSQSLEPQPNTLWSFDQRLSLSELLLGFLKYFAFDFEYVFSNINGLLNKFCGFQFRQRRNQHSNGQKGESISSDPESG